MSNAFTNRHRTPSEPGISVFDITPDDVADLVGLDGTDQQVPLGDEPGHRCCADHGE